MPSGVYKRRPEKEAVRLKAIRESQGKFSEKRWCEICQEWKDRIAKGERGYRLEREYGIHNSTVYAKLKRVILTTRGE